MDTFNPFQSGSKREHDSNSADEATAVSETDEPQQRQRSPKKGKAAMARPSPDPSDTLMDQGPSVETLEALMDRD